MKLFLIVWLLLGVSAYADGLSVGAGGGYNQFRLPNPAVGSSLYFGPGILTDLRYKLDLLVLAEERRVSLSNFSLEPFALFQYNSMTNSAVATEKHEQYGFGAGIDIGVNAFFAGVQYQRGKSNVSQDTLGSSFSYDITGYRLGVQFDLSGLWSAQVFGFWQHGTAHALDNGLSAPQPVYQLAGFIVIRYKLTAQENAFHKNLR